jgi:hypothetical protein
VLNKRAAAIDLITGLLGGHMTEVFKHLDVLIVVGCLIAAAAFIFWANRQ